MKTILTVLSLIVIFSTSLAQTHMLRGKVVDHETGEPIPFATVFLCDGTTGTTTDMDGLFILADTSDCDSLQVAFIGYLKTAVLIPEGSSFVTIEMNESTVTLDAVTITDHADAPLIEHDATVSGVVSYDYETRPSRKESAKLSEFRTTSSAEYYDEAPSSGYASDGISAGQLTAGEVNDFTKWDLWKDIDKTDLSSYNKQWGLYPENRYVVQVSNKNKLPVHNATAILLDESGSIVWTARTDNTGKAELWGGLFSGKAEKKYSIQVIYDNNTYPVKKAESFQSGINFIELPVECSQLKTVDIAFMIDATGSMGDEISYLQAELSDVMNRVKDSLPGYTIRLAILFYRDQGDSYVVIKQDFTTNINDAVKYLKSNSAGGGGDYPEAVDEALEASVNQLSWSDQAVARILFPVLDAPPHEEQQNLDRIHKSIPEASSKGIRIVPVACSGINKSTEYLLRSMSLATNGTYVFLTNHSGIGNPHIEPTTDEYKVEFLNQALVRIITNFSKSPECNKPIIDPDQMPDTAVANLPLPKDTATINPTDSSVVANDTLKSDTLKPLLPEISWRYYPNPTAGPVTIEIMNLPDTTQGYLYLTDLTGKLLNRWEVKENNFIEADISGYPTGTYYLTFFYGTESKLCAPLILMH